MALITLMFGIIVLLCSETKELSKRSLISEVTDIENYIIHSVNPLNIRHILRELTKQPGLGGTAEEMERAEWIAEIWRQQGMDEVHLTPYTVLLSYPSSTQPNLVRLLNEDKVMWVSAVKQKPLYAPEEALPSLPYTFNGYAAPGNVSGDVVYANYGRYEDFTLLAEKGINLTSRIVLARYGKIFRGNIAKMAEDRGAVGVVFFSDPADFAPNGSVFVYPHSSFMPPSAAPFGTTKLGSGDPLTPFYPAVESAYRIPEEEASLLKIPVQPISYEDAWHILSIMGGEEAPSSWQGGLNITYRLGPGLVHAGWTTHLDVNNANTMSTTHNVIGVFKGREEPDRYVILGNHYDGWLLGAVDPLSGTAAMLELSRVFISFHNETGWRPRRSLVFIGWGAEEYGFLGSLEWTEQFGKQLSDRAVTYLNVDMAIEGNYTLRTKSTPLLIDAIYESAKKIPNPDVDEVAAGRLSVYDTWAARRPDPLEPDIPLMQLIASGSDYQGFQHSLGIPCMDTRYTHDNVVLGDPMYHTLYETFALVDEIYDQGFHFHTAVTALWGHLALVFSDSQLLPFSLVTYAEFIMKAVAGIEDDYGELIASQNISLKYFTDAVQKFNESASSFTKKLNTVDLKNPLAVRHINDQMMMVERAFIDPQGIPGRPHDNHVVTAPSKYDGYSGMPFPGLVDTLIAIKEASAESHKELWRIFSHHLAAVTHFVNTAGKVLSDDLW
ncbi:hypothetical protein Pmani_010582 [Petrolisthes manimaculis]|uniref:Aminopeptidase NAALADL1 n=1 Tax=Petrolisthes manimaculis TaxID=1843537 RepID=A0AAE1Q1V3_9EUCA|nr:hypothetical protein Pmani_010582 [Petrolisthes manimaculis]